MREELAEELRSLQDRLWAEDTRSVLLVLQGLDTSGKDGTIRRVFTGVNPQACRVVSFKAPSEAELEHDYLWRVHAACPARGEIGIFNRSHYEDVGVARVKQLVPEAVWRRRYRHIREFERLLTDEGTTVVKVFLHISQGRAAQAAPGTPGRAHEDVEVPARRPRGPRAVRRLPRCLRRGARRDLDRVGPVACGTGRS